MNSGSLPSFFKLGGDSDRRIDYKQVDFGYKNQPIPPVNEFGKLDMATFLSDNADMMKLAVDEEQPKQKDNITLELSQLANDVAGSMSHRSLRS